jgi:hypothetical protein
MMASKTRNLIKFGVSIEKLYICGVDSRWPLKRFKPSGLVFPWG